MSAQATPLPNGAGDRTATTSDGPSTQPASSSSPARTPASSETQAEPRDWSGATDAERSGAIDALLRGKQDPDPEQGDADKTAPDAPEGGQERDDGDPDPWMPEEQDGDSHASEERPALANLAEAAERLGITPEALYDLSVTTGDGEAVKLGDLKDAWQDRKAEARETAKRAKDLDQRESALTADAQLWSQISDEVGKHLTPETRQRLRDRDKATDLNERRKLAAAMPELNDPDTMDRFKRSFVETLQGYGFAVHEMRITDHRNVLLVRDLMRTKARLDKLLSYEPDQKPPRAGKTKGRDTGKQGRQSEMIERAKSGTDYDKSRAISALLKGK